MLLLAPLLAEAVPVPRAVSRPTGSAGAQGTDGLCTHFRWMAEHAPVFRVPGSQVQILRSPEQFYQAMKVGVSWLRSSQFGMFSHPFTVTKEVWSVFPEGAHCWCHLMHLTSRQTADCSDQGNCLCFTSTCQQIPWLLLLLLLHNLLVSFLSQSGNMQPLRQHIHHL